MNEEWSLGIALHWHGGLKTDDLMCEVRWQNSGRYFTTFQRLDDLWDG